MNKQRGSSDVELVVSLVFLIIIVGIWAMVDAASCKSRWAQSGLSSTWGPIQGCLVKTKDGRIVPEEVIKDIDVLTPKADK